MCWNKDLHDSFWFLCGNEMGWSGRCGDFFCKKILEISHCVQNYFYRGLASPVFGQKIYEKLKDPIRKFLDMFGLGKNAGYVQLCTIISRDLVGRFGREYACWKAQIVYFLLKIWKFEFTDSFRFWHVSMFSSLKYGPIKYKVPLNRVIRNTFQLWPSILWRRVGS